LKERPFTHYQLLIAYVLIAATLAALFDFFLGNRVDYWVHDTAIIYQPRQHWKYSALVVLDNGIPASVGRKQVLPLFARAANQLINAGVKGIYLDARVSKQIETQMPYAQCIDETGKVHWSMPQCISTSANQCYLSNSPLGAAPLAMKPETIRHFSIAPYLDQQKLPDFLLYGLEANFNIPSSGLVASDRLVSKNSAIARWFDLSKDHAIYRLAHFLDLKTLKSHLQTNDDEICDGEFRCRRIRLSIPDYNLSRHKQSKPIFPLSQLAACDDSVARQTARQLADKIVVFQVSGLTEGVDVIITPLITAFFSPKLLVPGAQYLIDSIETLLNLDHPRAPNPLIKIALFILAAFTGVYCSINFKASYIWILGFIILTILISLCLFNPLIQLWPVSSTLLAFICGSLEGIGTRLILGYKEGKLINQYMPQPIRELLLAQDVNKGFKHQHCHAAVLMSDLAGYTTLTQLLNKPHFLLDLMNDYLSETSIILQDKYNGWLESYVGDMVCYYWPLQNNTDKNNTLDNVIHGALELADLQKKFFSSIHHRYQGKINETVLNKIHQIINAGIGISYGEVIMGDLGPKQGVQKFGILGNPLNIAARIESLTRQFNTEIIITGNYLDNINKTNWEVRHLGIINLKGGLKPESLYALGYANDPRFSPDIIKRWNLWLSEFLTSEKTRYQCPDIFAQDKITLTRWKQLNLLSKDGIWYLLEK
jgi:adenylate cyclase